MDRKQRSCVAQFKANSSDIRTETLRGQEYVVVPVVMLVEGVIQGVLAEAPELALCSEFGSNPAAWNGCPVSISHPQSGDTYVAAGSPSVWETVVVGFLFNTSVSNNSLLSEMWLDTQWANDHGFGDIITKLQSGETMEVSTGLFSNVVDVLGVWEGVSYQGIWTGCQPDHLALLPNAIGACSIEMGCGTNRVNSVNQTLHTNQTDQRLLAVQAAFTVQTKEIVMSTKKECTCDAAAVTAAVTEESVQANKSKKPGFFQRIMTAIAGPEMSPMERAFRDNLQGLSDMDLRTALQSAMVALDLKMSFYIVAVYDAFVVYESMDENNNWQLFQRNYTISNTVVSFSGEEIAVRPVTSFVPVSAVVSETGETGETGGTSVNEEEGGGQVSAEVVPAAAVEEVAPTKKEDDSPAINSQGEVKITSAEEAKQLALQSLGAGEAEIKEALAFREQQKGAMIDKILSATTNKFNKEELQAFTLQQLDKLASFSNVTSVNYAAAAGPEMKEVGDQKTFAPMQAFPLSLIHI